MSILVWWLITGLVLIGAAVLVGREAKYRKADGSEGSGHWLGILIDSHQRFSLTHFQTVLWALVFLSLFSAIFLARLFNQSAAADALNITIPPEVLGLAGISGGSAVLATAANSARDADATRNRVQSNRTFFSQIFMVEEGEMTDKVIDVTKFQNFFLTLIAVGAYIALALAVFSVLKVGEAPAGFPLFKSDVLWLIGISHAAYVGGKIPAKK